MLHKFRQWLNPEPLAPPEQAAEDWWPPVGIPPGNAYYCSACGWTFTAKEKAPCIVCGSALAFSVTNAVALLRRSLRARIQEAGLIPLTVEEAEARIKLNPNSYLTEKGGNWPKDAA